MRLKNLKVVNLYSKWEINLLRLLKHLKTIFKGHSGKWKEETEDPYQQLKKRLNSTEDLLISTILLSKMLVKTVHMLTSNVASITWNILKTTSERCTTFQLLLSTRQNNRNKPHCTSGPFQNLAKVFPTITVSVTEFELTFSYVVYGGVCNYHLE